jgi:hypothetical protein
VWFTLLIVITCLIGIPIGILVLLIALLILLPVHIGASGYYREEGYAAAGWVKALAGLVGVVFEYTEVGGQIQVVLGKWVIWQPKKDDEDVVQEQNKPKSPDPVQTQTVTKEVMPESGGAQTADEDPVSESVAPPIEIFSSPKVDAELPQDRTIEVESSEKAPKSTPSSVPPNLEEEKKPSVWARWKTLRIQLSRYLDYWHDARPIVGRFLKRLMRVLGFRYVDIDVVYGANDPAQTGRLFGYVEAVRPLLGKCSSLVLTPDFTQSRLEGAGAVEISLSLSRLLWAFLALVGRGGILGAKIWWRERQAKRNAILTEA